MKDNEIAGIGNSQDYGLRMYDPRLARFKSVDPLTHTYPMLTPYQFASNMPIWAKDLDGGEALGRWFPNCNDRIDHPAQGGSVPGVTSNIDGNVELVPDDVPVMYDGVSKKGKVVGGTPAP